MTNAKLLFLTIIVAGCIASAQEAVPPPTPPAETQAQGQASPPAEPAAEKAYTVAPGTRVPLLIINSISTRSAHEGDQVYLETAFPIVVNQKIVIPPGSYVRGTITQVKRPGRVKGRGELYLRFDSLTLPNGVTRDFRARVGAVDGGGSETLDREEGKIQGDTSKGSDAGTVASTAAAGTGVGAIAGSAGGRPGLGTGIGAAGGALAGLAMVLLTRGPDIQLFRGTELDMILDRSLVFREDELRFDGVQYHSNIPPAQRIDNRQQGGRTRLPLPFPY